jgi:ABC-type polysaccharide/polyol phosphate export permease
MSIIYDSQKRGPVFLEELRGIFQYRDLIVQLVRRDIVTRYKRSALGVAWTMLNPLGMMVVLTLVFSRLFHSIQSYPAYVLGGLIAWNFLAQTTSAALAMNIWGGPLLHQIYLPRSSFTISAIGTGLVNLSISILPLVLIMIFTRTPVTPALLYLPYAMLLLAVFSLGMGLLLSGLAIAFPDVVDMYQVGLTAWMYLTPVIYPAEIVPASLRPWLLGLNPMYYLLQNFRIPIHGGELPPLPVIAGATLLSAAALTLGWLVFSARADQLAYRT